MIVILNHVCSNIASNTYFDHMFKKNMLGLGVRQKKVLK